LRDNLIIRFKLKKPSTTERKLGLYNHIYVPIVAPLGLVGYLISQQAAKQLLLLTETIDRPVDDFLRLTKLTHIYSGEIYPSGIKTIDAELGGSTIGYQNMKKQDLSFLTKLLREIKRIIYQARLIV
jgi:GR25 family glycosyltransferase involved in LPS biosynthesis